MNVTGITTAVVEETGRVDLSTLIERWAISTIIRFHESDFYMRDTVANSLQAVVTPTYDLSLALPSRFRKFKYLRRLDSSGNVLGIFKEGVFNYPNDWFEIVGSNVVLHSQNLIAYHNWCYYEYPNIASGTSTTWMTDRYSQEIIDGVNYYVYRKIGDLETAGSLADLVDNPFTGHIARIRRECLTAQVS